MAPISFPKFHFHVEWSGSEIGFAEVTGLNVEIDLSDYREGGPSQKKSKIKIPRLKIPLLTKLTNICLKRGIFKGNQTQFNEWQKAVALNTGQKKDLMITLSNENQVPVKVWKVKSAFPVKVQIPDLNAEGNKIAIESIEIACEGFAILK